MKNKLLFSLLCLFFTAPCFAQERASAEEAAIKKVIEDETMYFNQRNYEKWAECVAHDPMTYYTWTTPFAGEDDVFEAKGWEEVSKAFKGFMETWPPDENLPTKENYQFKINGNMAYVTFTQTPFNSEESRVLEKKDGKWRILRMEALATEAFKKMRQLHALQRMAGEWEVDMSTFKKEGGGNWKMLGGTMKVKRTSTGIKTDEEFRFLNGEGEYRTSEECTMASLNMNTGKIGMLNSVHYPYSNWTESYQAVGSFDENGTLVSKGNAVGGEDSADLTMKIEGNQLHWSVKVKNKEGKQVYASSYSMNRVGAEEATKTKP